MVKARLISSVPVSTELPTATLIELQAEGAGTVRYLHPCSTSPLNVRMLPIAGEREDGHVE